MPPMQVPIPPRLLRASHALNEITEIYTLCVVQNFSIRTTQGTHLEFHPSQFLAEEENVADAAEVVRVARFRLERARDDFRDLCEVARDICQVVHDEQQHDRQVAQAKGFTQDKDKSFHLFPTLPAELQLMIWERAAQPPPSPLYFQSHKPGPGSAINEPAAALMQDLGLWTACKASSKTMVSLYAKEKERVEAADYDQDKAEANSIAGQHFDRIAQFNLRIVEMKGIMRDFHTEMVAAQARKEELMQQFIRQGGPAMEAVFQEHWGGQANLPIDALKRLIESLEAGNLFYVRR